MSGSRSRTSLRTRLFTLVAVGLIAAVLCVAVGFAGIHRVHADVVALDRHSVRPIAALGDVRDAQGDSRVNVWAYLALGANRTVVRSDIATSDLAVQDAITAYFAAHGSHTDPGGLLMTDFAARFAAWQQVRTTALRDADAGDSTAAYAVVHGPLAQANEAMATPMDQLFAQEVAASHRTATRADSSYRMVLIGLLAVLLLGLLAAIGSAWLVSRRILATVAVVRQALTRLAAGDLSDHHVDVRGTDELAEMAHATVTAAAEMRTVVQRLSSGVTTLDGAVERLSAGSASMEDNSTLAADQAAGASSAVSRVNESVKK